LDAGIRVEVNVAGTEVSDLLNAGARVVEE
jgi:hypothetical protein